MSTDFLNISRCTFCGCCNTKMEIESVSGAEQERSLSIAQVKLRPAWSPNG